MMAPVAAIVVFGAAPSDGGATGGATIFGAAVFVAGAGWLSVASFFCGFGDGLAGADGEISSGAAFVGGRRQRGLLTGRRKLLDLRQVRAGASHRGGLDDVGRGRRADFR